MPKKKNYPKWFSPYRNYLSKPLKPNQYHQRNKEIQEIKKGNYDSLYMGEIPEGTTSIYFEFKENDYCGEIVFTFFQEPEQVLNQNYEKEMIRYEKELAEYKEKLKEWKKWKKRWDEETEVEFEESQRQQYEKLKKKYGEEK